MSSKHSHWVASQAGHRAYDHKDRFWVEEYNLAANRWEFLEVGIPTWVEALGILR
jgi:hypothetical protein